MKRALLIVLLAAAALPAAAALGTAFTYQGRLLQDGQPATGAFDLQFRLLDPNAAELGVLVLEDVTVSGGLFSVELDFGAAAFTGEARTLETGVRPGAGTGAFTALAPAHPLRPVPHALALDGLRTIPGQNAGEPNVLGGAQSNTVGTFSGAAIGGGTHNTTAEDYVVIGGGWYNSADGFASVIGGGETNKASGTDSTIGGGNANEVSADAATVAGGDRNKAVGENSTVCGGSSNLAEKTESTVCGGYTNMATGEQSFVGGGGFNTAGSDYAAVGGGRYNTAGADYAAVASGSRNSATARFAFIGGGGKDELDPNSVGNRGTDEFGTVGGGQNNQAGDGDADLTDARFATVGGGNGNTASGANAAIGGGSGNTASGSSATVGGGSGNTASLNFTTVGGGSGNTASGFAASVPGGHSNTASAGYTFAAGRRAQATHTGAFVWADSTNADLSSDRANQFKVRAGGGVQLESDSTVAALDVRNADSGDLIVASSTQTRFRVDTSGNVQADGTFTSPAADFAELLPAAEADLEPGDVLAIGADGRLERSSAAYQSSVAGVHSTRPAFLGGAVEDAAGRVPLAVVGIVPVKASAENGPIRPGDLLVASSTAGHAMRAGGAAPQGSVLGKALAPLQSGTGSIRMLVILQ